MRAFIALLLLTLLPDAALAACRQALALGLDVSSSVHSREYRLQLDGLATAMLSGYALLEQRPDCWIRTLDISGDGEANTGPRPQTLPDPPAGVTVNALVIGVYGAEIGNLRQAKIKQLRAYFESNVIRGDGAFTESALGFDAYAEAMERKLLRELKAMLLGQLAPQP